MKEIIDLKEFKKLQKGKTENKILEIFKEYPDKAFHLSYFIKKGILKRSSLYVVLNNLVKTEVIEKRGEYYGLKKK